MHYSPPSSSLGVKLYLIGELESLLVFLDLLYSIKVKGTGVQKLFWRSSIQKGFDVRSYYKVLAPSGGKSLPWKSIWKPKDSTKVPFPLGYFFGEHPTSGELEEA